jgi:uncharacterized protein
MLHQSLPGNQYPKPLLKHQSSPMEFNKVTRGAKRAVNTEQSVYDILDAGFLCHVAFQHDGQAMMIPTAYGRSGDNIYLHGSSKNHMLNEICKGQTVCICVTHLDGVVLARSLFATSANYRSAILFGKANIISDEDERREGMRCITENIAKGRWDEVPIGSEQQYNATMVVKFEIESASAKIRRGGPEGDDEDEGIVWSGHIPMALKAATPVADAKFEQQFELSKSVLNFINKY